MTDNPQEPDEPTPAEVRTANVLSTYRSLRIGMVVLVGMLFLSVLVQAWTSGWCLQSSISEYFFTDAHSIFVGVLCALGALLLVYKGNTDTEDALYDFAGFWAFIVATVPTEWPTNLAADGESRTRGLCGGTGLPLAYDGGQAIYNNVVVVFAGLLMVLVVSSLLIPDKFWGAWTPLGWVARTIGFFITALLAGAFRFAPDWFERHGHNWAAVPMFAFIILAVWANAIFAKSDPDTPIGYSRAYFVVGIAMLITLIAVLALALALPSSLYVLLAEVLLLVEFAVFWIIQTAELWNSVRREQDHRHFPGAVSKL